MAGPNSNDHDQHPPEQPGEGAGRDESQDSASWDLDLTRPASGAPTEEILEEESPVGERKHDPYVALRHSNYRRFMLGWLFAIIALQVQQVAIGWEIYNRTESAMSLGWVAASLAVPNMLFAIPAGYLADVFSRKRLILLSAVGMSITSILLATVSFYQLPVWWVYLLLVLQGTVMTLGRPARQAILPHLVPHAAFPNAVMWNSSMFQISSVAGPALGGLIVAISLPAAYLVAAAGALVMIFAIALVRIKPAPRPKNAASFRTVLEGMRFLNRQRVVLAAISLDMFAVLLGGADYLLPIYARDLLGFGEVGYGWLRAAPALGAMIMAMILAHTPPMKNAGRAMLWAVVGFGIATIVFGISRNFWLSMAMLFLIGAFDNISVVVRHTLVQVLTPDSMRGRVSAVNGVFISASNELGGLESGLVASAFNPVVAVVSGGLGTIVSVGLIAALSPGLRKFGSLEDARPEEDPDDDSKQSS